MFAEYRQPGIRIRQARFSRTIDSIERIEELIQNHDCKAADEEWKSVVARHRPAASSLQIIVDFIRETEHKDLVSFTRKLQFFFLADNAELAISDETRNRAIKPAWVESLPACGTCNHLEIYEIIDAELLHVHLKW